MPARYGRQARSRATATVQTSTRGPPFGDSRTLPPPPPNSARDKAAERVGANRQYVSDAKQIAQDAPEILDHVKQGKLSIPQALKIAASPVNFQQEPLVPSMTPRRAANILSVT